MTTIITLTETKIRPRTSDGAVSCRRCGDIIPRGDRYQQETVSVSGMDVEVPVCIPCLTARDANDWVAAICVGSAVVIIMAVFAAVFGG